MRYIKNKLCCYFSVIIMTMIGAVSLNAQINDTGSDQSNSKQRLAHVYRQAHILSNRDIHTVVPLQSIIYQPTKNESKVTEAPSGKFRFWPDFLPENRDWLMTFEVTLEQAKGVDPIPDKKLEEFAKINRTVIATYRRNPISVRPFKKPSTSNTK